MTQNDALLTRDQRFARQAYEHVTQVKQLGKEKADQYGGMALKLSFLIRSAGLAQALAFVDARGKDSQTPLLEHLADTVGVSNLLKLSREVDLRGYMRLTRDVLDALIWYRRFAQSILDIDPTAADIKSEVQ